MRRFGGEVNVLSRPWGRRHERGGRRLGSRSFFEFGGLRVEKSRAPESTADDRQPTRQLFVSMEPLHKSETICE